MKEADNRFLQSELDKKEAVEALLIEGLKEVSHFQNKLQEELEKSEYQNHILRLELDRINAERSSNLNEKNQL